MRETFLALCHMVGLFFNSTTEGTLLLLKKMLMVRTIFVLFKSPILREILLMEWLLASLTIWVVVVYLVSTFKLDNFKEV